MNGKKKKIVFRADGNSQTGLGHLYRIFALVEIYRQGYDYVLLTASTSTSGIIPGSFNSRIMPDSVTIANEAVWLSKNYSPREWLVIADGYQFNEAYQKQLKAHGYYLVYIDDLITGHQYADVVVNHSMSVPSSAYEAEPNTVFALGPQYAILRPLFMEAAGRTREIKTIRAAFICFGGADHLDLTLKATEAILNFQDIEKINVVLGGAYSHEAIFKLAANNPRVAVYRNLGEAQLIALMEQSHVAIAPSSNILYELCAVKLPVLSGYYVGNQKNIYKGCVASGCIYDGGNLENYTVSDFIEKLAPILSRKDHAAILEAQSRLFDDAIRQRFLALLEPIRYRRAEAGDMLRLFEWSNEPLTRANSYSSEPIPLASHEKWFEKKLSDANSLLLIGELDGTPAGLVRYEAGADHAVVGVIVNETFRGRGLAAVFLRETAKLYFEQFNRPIYAYIKKENTASVRSFEKAGYSFLKEEAVSGHPSYVYKLDKPDD